MPPNIPLSIVVPSIGGWPALMGRLGSLEAAAERAEAELIIVDGSEEHVPPDAGIGRAVRWISQPGASVYQLRQRGYSLARGQIVATTEDHCIVPSDWGQRMLRAHIEWPAAAAVGGAVENGSTDRLIDWASCFVNGVRLMPPLRRGPTPVNVGHANVSYKRRALDHVDDHQGLGVVDVLHQITLRREGVQAYQDDGIRVSHVQSLGIRSTTAMHFHAGRTVAGFRRSQMNLVQWLRVAGLAVAPLARFGRIVNIGWSKPYRSKLVASAPWMLWLLFAQAVGQLFGYIGGPGKSPTKIA